MTHVLVLLLAEERARPEEAREQRDRALRLELPEGEAALALDLDGPGLVQELEDGVGHLTAGELAQAGDGGELHLDLAVLHRPLEDGLRALTADRARDRDGFGADLGIR